MRKPVIVPRDPDYVERSDVRGRHRMQRNYRTQWPWLVLILAGFLVVLILLVM